MNVIVIHKNKDSTTSSADGLLRFAISTEPIASVILDGLSRSLCWGRTGRIFCAIPEDWDIEPQASTLRIIRYRENVPICFEALRKTGRNSWFTISNGRFATQINNELLNKVLANTKADVVAVNAEPELLAYREKVRLTAQERVAGFRRLYSDSAEPASVPTDWPDHLFIKTKVLDWVASNCTLPQSFSAFLRRCRSNTLMLCAINVGGVVLDLETEDGLLNFCETRLSFPSHLSYRKIRDNSTSAAAGDNNVMSQDSRFVGEVILGKDIHIGPKVIVVGPTIISNNVTIKQGAVINSSIIGPGVCVPRNQFVQNCVIKEPQCDWKRLNRPKSRNSKQIYNPKVDLSQPQGSQTVFRDWPRFSYAGGLKRIADCFAAIIVLILFTPIFPFIALAIRLNSPGPIFFKDRRQGLHGKLFNCLKFRTMLVGADKIQDKLRIVSQVDGPQFKMDDDPRLSTVGRFLRDTYIDEIPQFLNVLLGQMSVVGPRPSPESENTLCPFWRDARLSVRPGITGLWQICRTRQPMKDFQEWIHYDIKYVRDLSLKMDLWICWQTTKKMFKNFVSQF